MTILFAIFAIILFIGVVGEEQKEKQKNLTYGFIAVVLAIILLQVI